MQRISLLVRIAQHGDALSGVLSISDAECAQQVAIEPNLFMLVLEQEADTSYTRGEFRSLQTRAAYPIQSNAALFSALSDYLAGHRPMSSS